MRDVSELGGHSGCELDRRVDTKASWQSPGVSRASPHRICLPRLLVLQIRGRRFHILKAQHRQPDTRQLRPTIATNPPSLKPVTQDSSFSLVQCP
jgi:hypothetical protein